MEIFKSALVHLFSLTLQKVVFICFNENSIKTMKNAFLFMWRFWLLRYLNFLIQQHNKKGKVDSKFMASQRGQQTIKIHIFSNTSISKVSQTSRI